MISENPHVVIAMPAHNESEGISEFLHEIHHSFDGVNHTFVIVNDLSSDSTLEAIAKAQQTIPVDIKTETNSRNLGHGQSTLRALELAIEQKPDFVIAVDGDGQFIGKEIRGLFDKVSASTSVVGEGIRTQRNEPLFRKVTSAFTRSLVAMRCRKFPKDANTPLRVYPIHIIAEILEYLPSTLLTPNLHISSYTRSRNIQFVEMEVTSLVRRGKSETGTMWKARTKVLPSKRFITFCLEATSQWFRVKL